MRGPTRAHRHIPPTQKRRAPPPSIMAFPVSSPGAILHHSLSSPQVPWMVKNRALSTTPIQFKGGSPEASVASPHFSSLLSTLATT